MIHNRYSEIKILVGCALTLLIYAGEKCGVTLVLTVVVVSTSLVGGKEITWVEKYEVKQVLTLVVSLAVMLEVVLAVVLTVIAKV